MSRRERRSPEDLRRRVARREPKRRILVVCEGGVTEAGYFKDLRAAFRNPLVAVEIDDKGGVPKTLVERATGRKREAERDAKSRRDVPRNWIEDVRTRTIRAAIPRPAFTV